MAASRLARWRQPWEKDVYAKAHMPTASFVPEYVVLVKCFYTLSDVGCFCGGAVPLHILTHHFEEISAASPHPQLSPAFVRPYETVVEFGSSSVSHTTHNIADAASPRAAAIDVMWLWLQCLRGRC